MLDIKIDENINPHVVRMCAVLTFKKGAKLDQFKAISHIFDNTSFGCNTNWIKRLFVEPKASSITIVQRIAYVNKEGHVDLTYPRPSMQMVIDELKKYLPYAEIEIVEDWFPFETKQYKLK